MDGCIHTKFGVPNVGTAQLVKGVKHIQTSFDGFKYFSPCNRLIYLPFSTKHPKQHQNKKGKYLQILFDDRKHLMWLNFQLPV